MSEVIKTAMTTVVRKYRLIVIGESVDGNYTEVRFANATTGLSVAIDWSELRPFLTISCLVDGMLELPDPDHGITQGPRYAFDADDLLLLRPVPETPVGKMLPSRDLAAAQRLLADYARALDQSASDVLSGDFTVFELLDKVVAARVRRMST